MSESFAKSVDNFQLNDLIKPDSGVGSKLYREAELLGDGLNAGFSARAGQAANNLGLTSMEILGSAVIGAGLRVMNDVGGEWGAAAKIGSRVTTRLTSVVRF